MNQNKRFVFYEHKGAEYILDTPNTELDFIEMLDDCLEAEEIVDILNELNDEVITLQLQDSDRKRYQRQLEKENKELKEQNQRLSEQKHIYKQDWKHLCIDKDLLDSENEQLKERIKDFSDENDQLKQALLFFIDVTNTEWSSNWLKDMERDCQKVFNCSYKEAKEKYGHYDDSWREND